jgi:hypothetical protein
MQLHPVEPGTGEIGCKKNLRAKLATYFAQLPLVRIAMEVQQRAAMCAGAERPGPRGGTVAGGAGATVRARQGQCGHARESWVAAQQGHIRRLPQQSIERQTAMALRVLRSAIHLEVGPRAASLEHAALP